MGITTIKFLIMQLSSVSGMFPQEDKLDTEI